MVEKIKALLEEISKKGHKTGYDWNADPENLTLLEGNIFELLDSLEPNQAVQRLKPLISNIRQVKL